MSGPMNRAMPPEKENMGPALQARSEELAMQLSDELRINPLIVQNGPYVSALAMLCIAGQMLGTGVTMSTYKATGELPDTDELKDKFAEQVQLMFLHYSASVTTSANAILNAMPEMQRDKEAGKVGVLDLSEVKFKRGQGRD